MAILELSPLTHIVFECRILLIIAWGKTASSEFLVLSMHCSHQILMGNASYNCLSMKLQFSWSLRVHYKWMATPHSWAITGNLWIYLYLDITYVDRKILSSQVFLIFIRLQFLIGITVSCHACLFNTRWKTEAQQFNWVIMDFCLHQYENHNEFLLDFPILSLHYRPIARPDK